MSMHIAAFGRMAAVAVAFGAFSSCATLTEDQCANVNWQQLGREDGAAGHAHGHIERHRAACAEHRLPVDEQQWSAGWQEGIRLYCTPENGLLQGREGRNYANSCPPELKADFESAYFVARRLHDARTSRDARQRELDSLIASLRRAEKREDRERIQRQIDTKRSDLRTAERNAWDAEGDYDRYMITFRSSQR